MTRCPTRLERYDWPTPMRLVTIGSTIIKPDWR